MKKTTQKATSLKTKINNIKQFTADAANTLFTTVKVAGVGSGGAYLLTQGIGANDVVFLGLGAVLAAYATIVLVSLAHVATKAARA